MSLTYRHYCPDGADRLSRGEPFEAESDQAAVALIEAKFPGSPCEIWLGRRLVKVNGHPTIVQAAKEPTETAAEGNSWVDRLEGDFHRVFAAAAEGRWAHALGANPRSGRFH